MLTRKRKAVPSEASVGKRVEPLHSPVVKVQEDGAAGERAAKRGAEGGF